MFQRGNALSQGSKLFSSFAVMFQLDGHFWLQWGLLLRRMEDHEGALSAFETSVEAYSENVYARHALAHQRLIVATKAKSLGAREREYIKMAVDKLKHQHEMSESTGWRITSEEYPIVVLAINHVEALLQHGENTEAQKVAKEYFRKLEEMHKRLPANQYLLDAREKVFRVATLGSMTT